MGYNFYACDRDQMLLMPASLEEWVGEGHLARFLRTAVEAMDLKVLYEKYREDGWGATAYDPRMMTEVLLYGYCMGVRSSRRIEKLCDEDVAFRYLAVNHRPDHVTLARFRRNHEKELEGLFTQVLRLCKEAGLLKVGLVSLDGTKIKATAALSANRTLNEEAKANVTDPESRIMKTRKGFIQGYNAQAVVTKEQIIVAADVTQEENDQGQLKPMMEEATRSLGALKMTRPIGVALADAGYDREENLKWALGRKSKTDYFIATQKDWKQRKAMRRKPGPRGRMPAGVSFKDRMTRKLLTRRGRRVYKLRSCTVEPEFGQMKGAQRFEGFSRKRLRAAQSEWKLAAAAHNLLKLWRNTNADRHGG